MTADALRAAQANRARRRRLASGETRATLVDLVPLGRFLETLTRRQLAAFVELVGEEVAERALWAAETDRAPEVARPVAG